MEKKKLLKNPNPQYPPRNLPAGGRPVHPAVVVRNREVRVLLAGGVIVGRTNDGGVLLEEDLTLVAGGVGLRVEIGLLVVVNHPVDVCGVGLIIEKDPIEVHPAVVRLLDRRHIINLPGVVFLGTTAVVLVLIGEVLLVTAPVGALLPEEVDLLVDGHPLLILTAGDGLILVIEEVKDHRRKDVPLPVKRREKENIYQDQDREIDDINELTLDFSPLD